jgi:hypothetical protein
MRGEAQPDAGGKRIKQKDQKLLCSGSGLGILGGIITIIGLAIRGWGKTRVDRGRVGDLAARVLFC